jgi:hypothetical protein
MGKRSSEKPQQIFRNEIVMKLLDYRLTIFLLIIGIAITGSYAVHLINSEQSKENELVAAIEKLCKPHGGMELYTALLVPQLVCKDGAVFADVMFCVNSLKDCEQVENKLEGRKNEK